jgi:hypothetical protein
MIGGIIICMVLILGGAFLIGMIFGISKELSSSETTYITEEEMKRRCPPSED